MNWKQIAFLLLFLSSVAVGIISIILWERKICLLYFGAIGIAVTLSYSCVLAYKIRTDSVKNRRLEKFFILFQAGLDLSIAIDQEILWAQLGQKEEIPTLGTPTTIIIILTYAVLIVLLMLAFMDLVRVRLRRYYNSASFKPSCFFLMFFLLGTGIYLTTNTYKDQRDALFMIQIVPLLLVFCIIIVNYWLTQIERQLPGGKILNYNWLIFIFLISADLLLGICSEYANDSLASVLDNIFEVIIQYMGLVNYKFYAEWLEMEKNNENDFLL